MTGSDKSKSTVFDEQTVLAEEWAQIKQTRGYGDDVRPGDLSGLALSGGGIRSAAFALGVLQGLAGAGVLEKIDYLSTVSGGGYIGSSLTWFLHHGYTLKNGAIPFGVPRHGAREIESEAAKRSGDEERRTRILNYIRQRGNYLTPGHCLNIFSLISVALRGLIPTLSVYFSLLVLVLYGLNRLLKPIPVSISGQSICATATDSLSSLTILFNPLLLFAIGFVGIFIACSVVYSWVTFFSFQDIRLRYWLRGVVQCSGGYLLLFTIGLLIVGSLPWTERLVCATADSLLQSGLIAGASTILGAIGAIVKIREKYLGGDTETGTGSQITIVISAALIIYGLLFLGFIVEQKVHTLPAMWHWLAPVLLISFTLISGIVVNTNLISPHRMYRDRLMEAFLPDPERFDHDKDSDDWGPAKAADVGLIDDMYQFPKPESVGPYHLVNTNTVLIDSQSTKFRGRGGDNFILSPLFCGSNATGWRLTVNFMKHGFTSNGMTLATAMAVSGAALNPDTGVGGRGPTRNTLLSFLMTILGMRLGLWAPNPRCPERPGAFWRYLPPNHFKPGLSALFGAAFAEDQGFVELTDGGHFENTGLYELIRRRLKIIVISDASADPKASFADFATAIERVRVDFGANIRFFDAETDLSGTLRGSATAGGNTPDIVKAVQVFVDKYQLAQRGYAIGNVYYAPRPDDPRSLDNEPDGWIFYIKATLTKRLPGDIYGYQATNPVFPHQSTSNQFFNEEQFDAYRELGYRLSKQMCDDLQGDKFAKQPYAPFFR